MGQIRIRRVRIRDAAAVKSLFKELGYEPSLKTVKRQISTYASSRTSLGVLAESEEGIAGLISFHMVPLFHADGYLGRITSLVVARGFRRKGVARRLVAFVEAFGEKKGCRRFEVTTGEKRKDAHQFYWNMDYRPASRRYIKEQ